MLCGWLRQGPVLRMVGGGRVNMHPRSRAAGPDIGRQFQAARIVERTHFEHHHLRHFFALAVNRRTAVGAEMAEQGVATIGRVLVNLGCAFGERDGAGWHDGVVAGSRTRGFLAVSAMAGGDDFNRLIERVADGAAQAAAGKRDCHAMLLEVG